MESPVRIFFVGNNPKGGKLRTHFEGKTLPTAIRVKGTTDSQPVKLRKNNKGIVTARWSSKNKYPNRMLTLELIDCGKVVQECKYDSCGDVIIENPKASISPTSSISMKAGVVTFNWTSIVEEAVDQYCSEKRPHGSTEEWDSFDADEPIGAGSNYVAVDQPTTSANIDYRLRAIYTDGTDLVLLNQNLNVVVPPMLDASVKNFAAKFNPDQGIVNVSWNSVAETGVLYYAIQLKGAQNPDYFDATSAEAVGTGASYAFEVFADGGDYSVQLKAVFNNNTTKILAETRVLVPVL